MMKLNPKSLLGLAMASALALPAAAETVRVYNWSDYIAEDTIEKFTAATGIDVTYDVFDSNEVLEAKVLSGQSGYDIVVPTTDFMARQIKAGAYQKLDKSKIPNLKNLDPELLKSLDNYDKGGEYSVPYQWGTNGVGYNVAKVQEILGDDAPTDSWDLVFDPKYADKLKDCGITMLDSASEILPLAMNYLGLDPNSKNPADYEKAQELLMKVRPDITYFHSSRYISDLANGEICVSVGWSGDIFQAASRAEEAENGIEISYYIPKEGTLMWADMMVIPKDAKNVDAAHAWINFILEPKIGAELTNYIWYGSPNKASEEFIDEEILSDPGIYPPKGTKLFTNETMPMKIDRVMTRIWTAIKKG